MSAHRRLLRRFRSPHTVRGAVITFEERSYAFRGWLNEQVRVQAADLEKYTTQRDNSLDSDEYDEATSSIVGAIAAIDTLTQVRLQLENFGLIPPAGDRMIDG